MFAFANGRRALRSGIGLAQADPPARRLSEQTQSRNQTLALSRPGVAGADPLSGPGGIGVLTARAPADHVAYAACHAAQAQALASSLHARAMSRATPQTVLGSFEGARIGHAGASARSFREGERFLVETLGRDGTPDTLEVSDTFGVYPLQQYLVTFPDGGGRCCRSPAISVRQPRAGSAGLCPAIP